MIPETQTPATAIIPHLKVVPTLKPNSTAAASGKDANTDYLKTKSGGGGANTVTRVEETGGEVTVTYTIWVNTNVTENHTMAVVVHYNSTFYNVMQLAALKDPHYT